MDHQVDYRDAIPSSITDQQDAVWRRVAEPGSWWSGEQRVRIAAEVRAARAVRSDPPWLRGEVADAPGPLPKAALDAVRRIAIEPQRLDREWCHGVVAELGEAAYVELVAVAVSVTAIDAFAEALGLEFDPLPTPVAGEPDRSTPDEMGEAGAWVRMRVPWKGPNVARALSLAAPRDHMMFLQLVGAMYALEDFSEPIWDKALSRPQIELVAARVSAVNECFY